jgi:hypothetical protein
VPLEATFNRDDAFKGRIETTNPEDYQEINVGIDTDPKMIKVGAGTTKEEKEKIRKLVIEYKGVFAWSYDVLKSYKEDIIQHTVPILPESKPIRKKLRMTNPKLPPTIKKELQKLLNIRIITPTRHTIWLSNPVMVRKKMSLIRLCVNFKNLNKSCIKDNYPLPYMEMLLQRITGSNIVFFGWIL